MKAKLITMAFLGIAILLLNAFPVHAYPPSEPHNANAMWIEPASLDLTAASVGYLFNITVAVNISTTIGVGVWQVKVMFNSTYFKAVRVGLTDIGKSDWFKGQIATMPMDPEINNVTGHVLHGESLLGPEVPSPGAGTLFWIEFNVTSIPSQILTLDFNITKTYLTEDTFILDTGLVTFTPYDGVAIIPEFSSPIMISIFMILALAATVFAKKKILKPNFTKQ